MIDGMFNFDDEVKKSDETSDNKPTD